jgi:hypothetical protein
MGAVKHGYNNTVTCLLKHGTNSNEQRLCCNLRLHMVKNIKIAKLLLNTNCDITSNQYVRNKGVHEITNLIEQYEFPLIKGPDVQY